MKNLIFTFCLVSFIFLLNETTFATTIIETPDAGHTMGTALVLPGGATQVNGGLGVAGDIDMYKFYVDMASTYGIYMTNTNPDDYSLLDPVLLLFNGSGQGLWGDDDGGYEKDSSISISLQVGWYFLAVSDNSLNAYDELDEWILADFDGPVLEGYENNILAYLTTGGTMTGDYFLTFSPATGGIPTPEPSTMILLSFGILGLAGISRKK